jgi:hypothetical protein
MAQSRGRDEDPAIQAAWDEAHGELNALPCDLAGARAAVTRYQDAVRRALGRGPGADTGTGAEPPAPPAALLTPEPAAAASPPPVPVGPSSSSPRPGTVPDPVAAPLAPPDPAPA